MYHKNNFDLLWIQYMNYCKYEQKLAYNTILRKEKTYNKYLKHKISKKIKKTNQK